MKEIVIKIDDGIYKLIMSMDKALATTAIRPKIFDAIRNGKVLPKGHHELIDRYDLMSAYRGSNNIFEALQKTNVIVEADKGEE